MSQDSITQLNGLRDYIISHKSQLELDTIKNVMVDFISDMDLKNKLINDVFPKTVWYCLRNSNADRDVLIGNLFDYFVKKGKDEYSALEQTSFALFLGGVDAQLNAIKKPAKRWKPNDGSHGGSKGGRGPNKKRIVWVILVAAALLLGFILVRSCGGKEENDDSLYSVIDVCRVYEGSIENGATKKACKMTISLETPDELKICVSNIYNQDDRMLYVGHVKKDKILFRDGPDLLIKKTSRGKITLNCNEKREGKWSFVSR